MSSIGWPFYTYPARLVCLVCLVGSMILRLDAFEQQSDARVLRRVLPVHRLGCSMCAVDRQHRTLTLIGPG